MRMGGEKILPGTGRGAGEAGGGAGAAANPSTTLRVVPLPFREDFQ